MKRCQTCPMFENGKGSKTCLKCSYYKRFQVKSCPRPQVPIDIIPDIIMESVADIAPEQDILNIIKQLPDDLSAIISMHYISSISIRSIASIMQVSEASVRRKHGIALTHIKKMFLKETV